MKLQGRSAASEAQPNDVECNSGAEVSCGEARMSRCEVSASQRARRHREVHLWYPRHIGSAAQKRTWLTPIVPYSGRQDWYNCKLHLYNVTLTYINRTTRKRSYYKQHVVNAISIQFESSNITRS